MAIRMTNDQYYSGIAGAIRRKNESNTTYYPSEMEAAIDAIETGGASSTPALLLVDYDYSVLYSYSMEEALALTALPSTGGTHEGLVFDGWNWTLAAIQSYITNHPDFLLEVQAQYTTTNNESRFYLTITDPNYVNIPFQFSLTSGSLTVDWGDGTTTTETGSTSHTYSPSSYPTNVVIKATYTGSGEVTWGLGTASVFSNTFAYNKLLTKVELGFGKLANFAFSPSRYLRTVILPKGLTEVSEYVFNSCYGIKNILIPNSCVTLRTNCFSSCHALNKVILPNTAANIYGGAFSLCYVLEKIVFNDDVRFNNSTIFYCNYSLKDFIFPDSSLAIAANQFNFCCTLERIKIPKSVSSIANGSFGLCTNLHFVDLSDHDTVPTLSDVSAFDSAAIDMQFAVKNQAMLQAFSTATNWSAFAGRYVVKGG